MREKREEERKSMFFFSMSRFHLFIFGPIGLKFREEVLDSLIFNLNGGDRIWSSGRLPFNPRTILDFEGEKEEFSSLPIFHQSSDLASPMVQSI